MIQKSYPTFNYVETKNGRDRCITILMMSLEGNFGKKKGFFSVLFWMWGSFVNCTGSLFSGLKAVDRKKGDERIEMDGWMVSRGCTWNMVTMAHRRESKFLRSQLVDWSLVLRQNLHPNKFMPRILLPICCPRNGEEKKIQEKININKKKRKRKKRKTLNINK